MVAITGISETIAKLNKKTNSLAIFSGAYYSDMNRRDLLRSLIEAPPFNGNQAEFARKIKKSPAQVHQWLSGYRALGDAGARGIELALGLGAGYFDGRAPLSGVPERRHEPAEPLPGWSYLTEAEKQEFMKLVSERASHNKAVMEQLVRPAEPAYAGPERRHEQAGPPGEERGGPPRMPATAKVIGPPVVPAASKRRKAS